MVTTTFGDIRISMTEGELPTLYAEYVSRSLLTDTFDLDSDASGLTCLGVTVGQELWPRLVVAQRYESACQVFHPEVLVVPETGLLFLGAGTRILAYDLRTPRRLWEDSTALGFWRWAGFGSVVVMSAEIECAAWSIDGVKLWSRFVEPPWDYRVEGSVVHLDVMGAKSSFSLATGQPEES